MNTERGNMIEREIVLVKELIPVRFEEIQVYIPTGFDIHLGKAVPTGFRKVPRLIPTDYEVVSKAIKIPRLEPHPLEPK